MTTATIHSATATTTSTPIVVPAHSDAVFDLDTLAHAIAEQGIAAHEHRVSAVAAAAHSRGCNPTLVDVLVDTSQPAVARERAFGALVASWLTTAGTPSTPAIAC
jgi:hypothetical protein